MEHPENDDKYKGLKVNQGVSEMPTVNPYMTKRVRRRQYTPAEYARECRFHTLEEYFKELEKEHEGLKKHVGLDASQRFTLSVDREKGIYAGKILAISEDGATITQQMGKGIVELDHRTSIWRIDHLIVLIICNRVLLSDFLKIILKRIYASE